MIYAALIGHPVAHSVAPLLHDDLAQLAGLSRNDFAYLKIDGAAGEIGQILDRLEALGFAGGNITTPFKRSVISQLELDDAAQFIGAVNTFTFRAGHRLGTNTDWCGPYESLKRTNVGHSGTFVILGSGGAARAVIYAAKKLGFNKIVVLHTNHWHPDTKDLLDRAAELGITMHSYDAPLDAILSQATVIYNATTTGMAGTPPAPFELSRLHGVSLQGTIVAEAIYQPLITPLLAHAQAAGAHVIDGAWWTVYQGVPAFNLWTERRITPSDEQLIALHDHLATALTS